MGGDHLARLRAAMVAVDRARTVTELRGLHTAVREARDVPPIRKDAGQFEDLGRQFTRHAERLAARPAVRRVPIEAELLTAIVGRTGVVAAEGIRVLEAECARAERTMRRAAKACEDLYDARTEAERSDRTGIDTLTGLLDTIGETMALDRRTAGLPDLVTRLRESAIDALNLRLGPHANLEKWAGATARLLYDLAGEAVLARLGPSPLPAVDEMVIAAAGRDDSWGPVLTPAAAKRAAKRLNSLGEAGRAEIERLLARAHGAHERAYLLKALAAGNTAGQVAEFADRIHAFGADPAWLDQHLAPLDSSSAGTDAAAAFGTAPWKQGNVPQCVPYSLIAARAQIDPIYALNLTTGGDPGNPAEDNSTRFAERLRAEADRLFGDGRRWTSYSTIGVSTFGMEQLADSHLGRRLDVDFETRRLDRPLDDNVITEITRSVDNGVPVLLGVSDRDGGRGHATIVIGYRDEEVQIYDPLVGGTFWTPVQDLRVGMLDREGRVTPPVPFVAYLPR